MDLEWLKSWIAQGGLAVLAGFSFWWAIRKDKAKDSADVKHAKELKDQRDSYELEVRATRKECDDERVRHANELKDLTERYMAKNDTLVGKNFEIADRCSVVLQSAFRKMPAK